MKCISDIITIICIINILQDKGTYCIWDDVTCSGQKRRHPHKTKQLTENFQYPQDMNLEISFLNWPSQRRGHAGVILMFQDGK